jgi:crossover junction endodeoxyribonuclease RuvC
MLKREHSRASTSLRVVGIDPGLANLGLGAVEQHYRDLHYLGSQLIRTDAKMAQTTRLKLLFDGTHAFLTKHRPDALALEGQYFHRQREIAFKVGQAVGVCLLAAADLEIPVFEYGPMQVKQTLVGTGAASKSQIAFMVRAMLKLKQVPESSHVADALALALTHLSHKLQLLLQK